MSGLFWLCWRSVDFFVWPVPFSPMPAGSRPPLGVLCSPAFNSSALRRFSLAQLLRHVVQHVDDQHDVEIPLLDELPHVRCTASGGDLPVDGADVVPDLISAHVGELEAAPQIDRGVLAAEEGLHEAPGSQLEPANPSGLLSAFETYGHADDSLPPLVRAGLLHVQFESIHPYLDGNGRIGRLLVTLLLAGHNLAAQYLLI